MSSCEICRATAELEFDSEGRRVCRDCANARVLEEVRTEQRAHAKGNPLAGCIGLPVLLAVLALPCLFAWGAYENASNGFEMLGAETVSGRIVEVEYHPRRRRTPGSYEWTVSLPNSEQTCTLRTFTEEHRLGDPIAVDVLERDGSLLCEEAGSHDSLWLAGCLACPVVLLALAVGAFFWLGRQKKRA